MAFGTKTNERPGVRAELRNARFSAYKAREVLDLIRGLTIAEARGVLEFTERACAGPILKCLDSAVANAGNNNDIPPEELVVSACFADEGPTLKRFRPRARGRAGRIRKRTCHVTIIVGRMSSAQLELERARTGRRRTAPGDPGASRARRVARSRTAGGPSAPAAEVVDASVVEADVVEADPVEADVVEPAGTDVADTDVADAGAVEVEAADADEPVAGATDDEPATAEATDADAGEADENREDT